MSIHHSLLEDLDNAISRGSSEQRGETARHIAQLFAHGAENFTDEQIALFDDVFMRLVSEIESSARAILADTLASIPNAPPKIIRALAFDDAADVASPVLAVSSRLDDASLIDNALTKSQRHLLAITRRPTLAEAITDVLVDRGDRDVVLSISVNAGARFSDKGFTRLVQRANGDDELAARVGTRREIPRHHFLKLLALASDVVRAKLEAANPQATSEIQRVVAEVTNRMRARMPIVERDYGSALELVSEIKERGGIDQRELESFANQGKFEETTAALASMCDLPISVVDRAMVQDRAEFLLILARSLDLSWHTTKAILLLRAGERELPTSEIEQCLASFERLKPETAAQVVRHHRGPKAPPRQ